MAIRRLVRLTHIIIFVTFSHMLMAEDDGSVVDELAWGEALYYHFKGDKIEALTRLSARLAQGKLENNKPQAELLLAGILLDYGLPDEANRILARLNILESSPQLRAKMLLANARVYYQQQQFAKAKATLSVTDFSLLDEHNKTQARFMLAEIQFGLGEFAASADTLNSIEDSSNLNLYAKYNLGLSLLNVNDNQSQQQAIQALSQVANTETYDQEQYALADQAKLALGLHALNQSQYSAAHDILQSIRLDGLVSDEALLLLGWNAFQQSLFDASLTYWTSLAGSDDLLSPVVQEAWLAVPYAWQKRGDTSRARAGYETALKVQQRALVQLSRLSEQDIWRDVLQGNDASAASVSQALYQQLAASPAFFELKDQWLELQQLDDILAANAKSLPVMALAVRESKERFFAKSAEAKQTLSSINLDEVTQLVADYQAQLDEQLTMTIAPALMTDREATVWHRIDRSLTTLAEVNDDHAMADKAEQLRRLKGVFHWQYHRDIKAKEWQAKQSQKTLEHALEVLKAQHGSLIQIIEQAQPPIDVDADKLSNLTNAIAELRVEINSVSKALETRMKDVYRQFIVERQQALVNLAEQANLSLARLSFVAATKGQDDE